MPRTWLQIKVELVGGMGGELQPPPGRVFALSPSLSFERLAREINVGFGRWDFSHLHVFELADGRRVGFEDVDFEQRGWVNHGEKVGSLLAPGDRFEFVFDFGDDWRHRCEVLAEKLDAREEFGELPSGPVILWGWGWMPDQYGRETEDG